MLFTQEEYDVVFLEKPSKHGKSHFLLFTFIRRKYMIPILSRKTC